jgi:hypothetical protein
MAQAWRDLATKRDDEQKEDPVKAHLAARDLFQRGGCHGSVARWTQLTEIRASCRQNA